MEIYWWFYKVNKIQCYPKTIISKTIYLSINFPQFSHRQFVFVDPLPHFTLLIFPLLLFCRFWWCPQIPGTVKCYQLQIACWHRCASIQQNKRCFLKKEWRSRFRSLLFPMFPLHSHPNFKHFHRHTLPHQYVDLGAIFLLTWQW